MSVLALDAIKFHRFGLAGREPLLLMLAASLLTFGVTRSYTRVARVRRWGSGRVGEIHVHHMVAGTVLTLVCGMLEIAFQPLDFGLDLLSVGFGIGAAFVLDEFALSVHLRDVYWTPEGRHSIEVDRKSTRLHSSHLVNSYADFCLKKKIGGGQAVTADRLDDGERLLQLPFTPL